MTTIGAWLAGTRRALWMLAALTCAAGAAAEPSGDAAERQRIDQERAAAERRFDEARARCDSRFLVTACVDEARAERRAQMQRLDHERSVLDTQARRRRAAQRLQRIDEKQRDAAARPAVERGARAVPKAVVRPAPPASVAAPDPVPPQAASPAQRQRPQARDAWERRQREAEAHRQAVQRRNAERAARRKPAAPLPEGS